MTRVSTASRYSAPEFRLVSFDQYDRLRAHFRERHRQIAKLVVGEFGPRPSIKLRNTGFATTRGVMVLATIAAPVPSRPAGADDRGAAGVEAARPASS